MESFGIDFQAVRTEPLANQVERYVERLIRTRSLAPNQRLPTSRELSRQWKVDYKAVEQGLKRLKTRGLITRLPKRGTFVSENPNQVVIGMLVGPDLLDPEAAFYRALAQNLKAEIATRDFHTRLYDQLNVGDRNRVEESRQHLLQDIRNHHFKGLVLVSVAPGLIKNEALLSDLPRAVLGDSRDKSLFGADIDAFLEQALSYLRKHQRRRPVYVRAGSINHPTPPDLDFFRETARRLGMEVGPDSARHLPVHWPRNERSIEENTRTLFLELHAEWERRRFAPDALVVYDDVAMTGVARALGQLGVRVPERLLVISQANTGIEYPYAVPVVRVELDPAEVAHRLVDRLWQQILGEPGPALPAQVPYRLKEPIPERVLQPQNTPVA